MKSYEVSRFMLYLFIILVLCCSASSFHLPHVLKGKRYLLNSPREGSTEVLVQKYPYGTLMNPYFNRNWTRHLSSLSVKELNNSAHTLLQYLDNPSSLKFIDYITISATISSCQRASLHVIALRLFWSWQQTTNDVDSILMKSALRAAALSANRDQILKLLDLSVKIFERFDAMKCLCATVESLAYCKSMKIERNADNLKKISFQKLSLPQYSVQSCLLNLQSWADEQGFLSDNTVLEAFLLAAVRLRIDSIRKMALSSLSNHDAMTTRSCAILFNFNAENYANDSNAETNIREIEYSMNKCGIQKNIVCFNALLKYGIVTGNTTYLEQLLFEMQEMRITGDRFTESLLHKACFSAMINEEQLLKWRQILFDNYTVSSFETRSYSTISQTKNPPKIQTEKSRFSSLDASRKNYHTNNINPATESVFVSCQRVLHLSDAKTVLKVVSQHAYPDTTLLLTAATKMLSLRQPMDALSLCTAAVSGLSRVSTFQERQKQQENILRVTVTLAVECLLQNQDSAQKFMSFVFQTLDHFILEQEHQCEESTSCCIFTQFSRLCRVSLQQEEISTSSGCDSINNKSKVNLVKDICLMSRLLWLRTKYFPDRLLPPSALHTLTSALQVLIHQIQSYSFIENMNISKTCNHTTCEENNTSCCDIILQNENDSKSFSTLQKELEKFKNLLLSYVQFVLSTENNIISDSIMSNSIHEIKAPAKYDQNTRPWKGWSIAFLEKILLVFVKTHQHTSESTPSMVLQYLTLLHSFPFIRPSGVIFFEFAQFFSTEVKSNKEESCIAYSTLLQWMGDNKHILAPQAIINVAISQLYKHGEKHLALTLFNRIDQVRNKSLTSAWYNDETDGRPTIDLHYRSRGMAYVLLLSSLRQVLERSFIQGIDLIRIITGKNLSNKRKYLHKKDNKMKSEYCLSDEVQQILIEEFFPPISSSTEPGNPGRIIIRLKDVGL